MGLRNPYADSGDSRNPVTRTSRYKLAGNAVNGYVKFRLRPTPEHQQEQTRVTSGLPFLSSASVGMAMHHRQKRRKTSPPREKITYISRDFGNVSKLNGDDWKLFKFYTVGYCDGRTILPNGNYWLSEFPSIAAEDDSIKHALLALAGAYLLDYFNSDALRRRTVNWELRKSNGEEPHWLRGAYLAKSILDHTDPGYRYWKPENVQCSRARASNGNIVAQTCILAQIVLPLPADEDCSGFGWLLEGTARETRRIRSTGLCPKLLHYFHVITSLCGRLKHDPQSEMPPRVGERLLEQLDNFRQWSELSEGCKTTDELFASCRPDRDGKVSDDKAKVVELTAESWVWCAKIYLQCRLFRKPYTHPDVRAALAVLRRCLQLLPFEGGLFTSQFPFFAVALASLLARTEADRVLPRAWFKGLVAEAKCRSSVPPVWDTIQKMWEWMDASFADLDESYDEAQIVSERRDWWEEMVTWLLQNFGYMHLA
ncbi:hypothetical protein SLS62_009707 [Diatrype stigma]|uniref:Uncharacterized protein n=1 Tax=Diatrype stigma TaxID=117547 RepID=A0AAN9UEU1_9PEZI